MNEFDDTPPPLQEAPSPHDDVTRALPHAVGPEKSLLSSMMKDPQGYLGIAVEKNLTKDHFYLPSHATLFGFMLDLFNGNQAIELVSLTQKLLDKGLLDRVGGPSALAELYSYAPSSGHFHHHLELVKDKYVLRSIIQRSNEAIASAYDAPDEVAELLDTVEQGILAIREGSETQTTLRRVSGDVEAISAAFMESLTNTGPRKPRGIATGFADIDRKTGGMIPGEVFVIAARPSVGKTSLMMNIVEHVAVDDQIPSLVFSLEMPREAVVRRVLFGRAKVSLEDVDHGREWAKHDLQRIQAATHAVHSAPMWLDDRSGLTIQEIRAKARRSHREHGIQFIAIDYLQLCRSRSKQATFSREREIGEISAGLKEIAKELHVPVLVLAQLNRDVEKRAGANPGKPRLSDLRESGTIEQDADVIGLLWRKDYQASPDQAAELCGQSTLTIAKNRNGPTGDCPLTFIASLCRFETGEPVQETLFEETKPKSRYER